MIAVCEHTNYEREVAAYADGLCAYCLRAELSALRAHQKALERYTRHLDGCERNYDPDRPTTDPRPCTCGLAELKEANHE